MSSFLLSLGLGMFAVAQAVTSLIHDCIEWSSWDILSGGADICNCKSSANECCMIEWVNNDRQRPIINGEKHSAKNWTLRNTWVHRSKGRRMIRWRDVVCTISQIRRKPLMDSISKSKVSMETVNKDRMIICVKCWRKVKQGKNRYVAFAKRKEQIINNFHKSCFSAVTRTIYWLTSILEIMRVEVGRNLG